MNACLLLLCVALSSGSGRMDRWLGEDKFQHFFASFAATAVATGAARAAGLDASSSIAVGAGTGAALGIWKEIRDERIPGRRASFRDLVWDFAGVGAAAIVAAQAR
jgi:uncharacterized protein YfiM (DUF2279 family)